MLRTLLLVVTLLITLGFSVAGRAESPVGEPLDTLIPPADLDVPGAAAPTEPARPASPRLERDAVPPPLGITDLAAPILKTFLMLGVVLFIAYLSLHKGLGKLVERQTAGKRVKVVERIGLDQRRSLYLVDVDGQQMLLGGSDHGVVHLKDLAQKPPESTAPKPGLVARFSEVFDKSAGAKNTAAVPRSDATEGAKS